ncbi:hypothetical protein ALC56_03772 [Trachymyrmex septentrionalis]|uniref:Uncharacterized protein n=1 Tax=Trachymyrmex septentrionalis TaxID=34720 RepID=A0A195FNF8_9HYME|nr:hypothetical protein ALC56_03772 [Trachymyrmex septentrionalis]
MTSGLCAVCSHRRVAPAGGPHPEEVFSVGAELHRPLALSTATARLESDLQRSEQPKTHVLDIQVFKFYKLCNNYHRIPYESLFYLAGHSDIPVLNLVAQTHFGAFFTSLSFFFIYLIQNPMTYWFSGFSNHTYERYEAANGSDSRQKEAVNLLFLFQHRNIPLDISQTLYQVQHTLADVTVVGIFSTAEYDSVLRIVFQLRLATTPLPVLSTCTRLTRPGVRPIVIVLSLPLTPSERECSLLPRNWIKRNGNERLTLNSLNASRTNVVETCISAQSAPNFHVPLRRFHDSLGILFAWKISSDTYSLKLKNITRHNLLPTTCQSIEYVARDVSPGMSCGR